MNRRKATLETFTGALCRTASRCATRPVLKIAPPLPALTDQEAEVLQELIEMGIKHIGRRLEPIDPRGAHLALRSAFVTLTGTYISVRWFLYLANTGGAACI